MSKSKQVTKSPSLPLGHPRAEPKHKSYRRRTNHPALLIESRSPSYEALVSAVCGWLVPTLVEQFLAEKGLVAKSLSKNRRTTSEVISKEHAQEPRVN